MPLYNPGVDGNISQLGDVLFSTSTPVVDQQVNLSLLNPRTAWYARLGNLVYANALFQVQSTAAAQSSFRVSLPVGMQNFQNINQLIGGGFNSPNPSFQIQAVSDWQNDSVYVFWTPPSTGLYDIVVWSGYFLQ